MQTNGMGSAKWRRWAGLTWLWQLLLLLVAAPNQGSAEIIYWPMEGLTLAKHRALSIECGNHLAQIGYLARNWSLDNASQCPPDLRTLAAGSDVPPGVLFCPENNAHFAPTNWTDLDWAQVDYEWYPPLFPGSWPDDPAAICCRCRVHEIVLHADGSVHQLGGFRPGWPAPVASPLSQEVTPGTDVRLTVQIAPDARPPVAYQWRREELYYVTNITSTPDPEDPRTLIWSTNRQAQFAPTPLAGETNPSCLLAHVTEADAGYYSVAASNPLGTAVCAPAWLRVDAAVAARAADQTCAKQNCLNNLQQLALMAQLWALQHRGALPEDWKQMTNASGLPMFGWPLALFCRSDTARSAPADWATLDFANTSYDLAPAYRNDPYSVFCRCKIHDCYVQADGEIMVAPRFETIRTLPSQRVEVAFRLFADRTNLLETSPDLRTWTTVAAFDSQHGPVVFTDTNGVERAFFRVRLP